MIDERNEDKERKWKRNKRFRLFGTVTSLTLTIGFQWILIEVWTVSIDLFDMKNNVTKYEGLTHLHQKGSSKRFGHVRVRQKKKKKEFFELYCFRLWIFEMWDETEAIKILYYGWTMNTEHLTSIFHRPKCKSIYNPK